MEAQDIEQEIIKEYQKGVPRNRIRTEFEIDDFQLAWILGKHGISRRSRKAGIGRTEIKISSFDGSITFPRAILRKLNLYNKELRGKYLKFEVVDAKEKIVKLELMDETR